VFWPEICPPVKFLQRGGVRNIRAPIAVQTRYRIFVRKTSKLHHMFIDFEADEIKPNKAHNWCGGSQVSPLTNARILSMGPWSGILVRFYPDKLKNPHCYLT